MKILSIETSCDETAVSLIKATGDFPHAHYEILGNALWSQVELHREYGGVFPALAKREHARTLVPVLEEALEEAEEIKDIEEEAGGISAAGSARLQTLLEREPNLADALITFHKKYGTIECDIIAVTSGPGLEPALWVGVNFAKALALLWNTPIVAVNHMEGHILASLFDADRDDQLSDITFPAISLLISGGHTELVLMKDWGNYEKIGQTRDDAVGEAFDKVARLLGLPYPGGPEISRLAATARKQSLPEFAPLPRPMLRSDDLDFSFSGLKTAVRYAVQGKVNAEDREDTLGCKELTDNERAAVARDFEDAVTDVLIKKSCSAIEETGAKTLIVGGGVSANQYIKRALEKTLLTEYPDVECFFPQPGLSTDNSIMIALAGHARAGNALAPNGADVILADGNRSL